MALPTPKHIDIIRGRHYSRTSSTLFEDTHQSFNTIIIIRGHPSSWALFEDTHQPFNTIIIIRGHPSIVRHHHHFSRTPIIIRGHPSIVRHHHYSRAPVVYLTSVAGDIIRGHPSIVRHHHHHHYSRTPINRSTPSLFEGTRCLLDIRGR
jgi:hypothetical protein